MIKLKNTFELCDTWRLRSLKIKRFTFLTGFIQSRLDFFCFKCFARVYSQNRYFSFVLQWPLTILFVLRKIKWEKAYRNLIVLYYQIKKIVRKIKNRIATTTIFLTRKIYSMIKYDGNIKYKIRNFLCTFLHLNSKKKETRR